MLLDEGCYDVAPGNIADVITYLEMRRRPCGPVQEPADGLSLAEMPRPDLTWYRTMMNVVGAQHLWSQRLLLADAALREILHDPGVEVYALRNQHRDAGLLELDFRCAGECEIVFFGVAPDAIGRGAGPWMMREALARAWSKPAIERVWLHTCTLDHARAVPFYLRCGFVPYKRQVEVLRDLRARGVLPKDCAPAIPLL